MKQKEIIVKNKIINHLTKDGQKHVSENIFLKSLKELQKVSNKQTNELIKISIFFATPAFKLHKTSNKKRRKKIGNSNNKIPTFIQSEEARTSLAIKFLIEGALKKKEKGLSQKFAQELLAGASQLSNAENIKKESQKEALLQKHLLKYFKK